MCWECVGGRRNFEPCATLNVTVPKCVLIKHVSGEQSSLLNSLSVQIATAHIYVLHNNVTTVREDDTSSTTSNLKADQVALFFHDARTVG